MKRALAALLLAAALLAGCTGQTTPPVTDRTATSATVHGDVTWTQADANAGEQWRWEWSPDGFQTVLHNAYQAVPGCGTDPCSQHIDQGVPFLSPATTYQYRLAMTVNGSTFYGDSDGCCGSPPAYDAFTTLSGYPSLDTISFDGDFDYAGGCSVSNPSGPNWNNVESEGGGTVTQEMGTVGQGNCSAKSQIPGNANQQQERAELSRNTNYSSPVTLTWEALYFIPTLANNGPDHGAIDQLKQGGSGSGCANGGLYIDDATGRLTYRTREDCSHDSVPHYFGPVGGAPRGQWIGVKVTEFFVANTTGYVTVWYDDDGGGPDAYTQVVNDTAIKTVGTTGDAVKPRQGLYGDANASHETHVYIDGFHIK